MIVLKGASGVPCPVSSLPFFSDVYISADLERLENQIFIEEIMELLGNYGDSLNVRPAIASSAISMRSWNSLQIEGFTYYFHLEIGKCGDVEINGGN